MSFFDDDDFYSSDRAERDMYNKIRTEERIKRKIQKQKAIKKRNKTNTKKIKDNYDLYNSRSRRSFFFI